MKVSSLDELERVLQLVNQHKIDVLELGDLKIVRSSAVAFPAVAIEQPSERRDDIEELIAWSEGGSA